ncbi:hypothetical protein F4813DRAFT_350693 [Daldinia decipiens]|uniref:uncharacterized protein n=1 Tax=Daldinia decipiens TaxID=326647 RepID=UPI0020C293CC|nr:uncharacterized protein F4813DRAFT_350693 [Daldinia decipiens]KAI1660015.1 hypothetical protein F4813DRAFT_350693 [Daldinia decipiens]
MNSITLKMTGESSTRTQYYTEYSQSISQPFSNSESPDQAELGQFGCIKSFGSHSSNSGHYPYWGRERDRYHWQEMLVKKLVHAKYTRLDQTQHPLLSYFRQLARAEELELWYRKRKLRKEQEKNKRCRNIP